MTLDHTSKASFLSGILLASFNWMDTIEGYLNLYILIGSCIFVTIGIFIRIKDYKKKANDVNRNDANNSRV